MNTPADWARVNTVFHRALELPSGERADFVRRETAGDEEMCHEVESLLAAYPGARGFLGASAIETSSAGAPPSAVVRLPPGTRLGHFEILGTLGAGGMGEVHRALDTRLERVVAIKVLSSDLADDPRSRERFEREARLVSRLTHPHICTLHDVGSVNVDGHDVSFLVMELLEGETLADRLRRGPLPVGEAIQSALEILDALAAAHAMGIVHRDLKPANIMLTRGGVKLLDFGLARLHDPAPAAGAYESEPLTVPGLVFGTIPYMAPEQIRGGRADARTDLFAFGSVFYEMLTGRRAFSAGSEPALIAAILEENPPPLTAGQPLAPPALDRLVRACLAKNPADRWQHAQDVALALGAVAEGRALTGPPAAAAKLEGRPRLAAIARHWRLHLAWAAALIALAALAWSLAPAPRAPVPPANPRPVIVLMDSPLVGRVYDPRTLAAGGTNADDVTDALRELDVVTFKENTSPMWHREEQVRQQHPDLVISHLSCLLDQRVSNGDAAVREHLFSIAVHRLMAVFAYLASTNPRTKFLIYSRGYWPTREAELSWTGDVVARFPTLDGRIFTMVVPGRDKATFRDPATAQQRRVRVQEVLGVP
jgi:Protein kinase domain